MIALGTNLAADGAAAAPRAISLVIASLWKRRGQFLLLALAAALANALALATSLYSMQVYDRVIPTGGHSTLIALSIGVLLATGFEFLIRQIRSRILEQLSAEVDVELSGGLFKRLMSVRLQAMPGNSGVLAAQARSLDQVRAFVTMAVLFLAFDAPFAVLFAVVILVIGGPMMAAVPAAVLVLGLVLGLLHLGVIVRRTRSTFEGQTHRQGVLVESTASLESLRAASLTHAATRRWDEVSSVCADSEAAVRRSADSVQVWTGWLQQVGYVALIAVGAHLVAATDTLTVGALTACSLIGSRVFGPFAALPNLLAQWGFTAVALRTLDGLYRLPAEPAEGGGALQPISLLGSWQLHGVQHQPDPRRPALSFPDIRIASGERVGVIGPAGCGKSTLLRLLAGLHSPTRGLVLLDGMNLDQVCRTTLRRKVACMPQESRLLSGTLRDNFEPALGSPDGAQLLMAAMNATGLDAVVASHPMGLDMPLGEGGAGLSMGQRQLASFTRLLLQDANAWLLDEPTAAMDERAERRCIQALLQVARPSHTIVVATHRLEWLNAVNRLIALTPEGRLLDGPRDAVLAHLRAAGDPRGPLAAQQHNHKQEKQHADA